MTDKRDTQEINDGLQVASKGPGPGIDTIEGVQVLDGQDKNNDDAANGNAVPQHYIEDKPYTVFTHSEKKTIIVCASLAQFFSPISGQIYFPSLDVIAADLHVSGIAPAFVGGFSDSFGRRPTYFISCLVYLAANVGLAIQNNYAALMVLRCLQSAGGAGTVALANTLVSDIVTSQECGKYVSYMAVAPQVGPSLGPIIGGLLGQYLGWHSVFWFLCICSGVVFVPDALFLAETCRNIVEDGSVPPPKLRHCYINTKVEKRFIAEGRPIPYDKRDELARKRKLKVPNPLETIKIVLTKEAGYVLAYIGVLCTGYYATVALIPSQFGTTYKFNQLQISLCYLPLGCGSLLASFVRSRVIDSRYKAHAKLFGIPLEYNRQADLSNFPIEKVRLEAAIPTIVLGSLCFIGFGWMIQYKINLSGPLILLFLIGFCVSASLNTVGVLLVDLYPGKAGTSSAANNLVRCWLGAGATSGVTPLVNKAGIGWTTTFFGLLCTAFSPILWHIMKNGLKWRRATKERKKEAARY